MTETLKSFNGLSYRQEYTVTINGLHFNYQLNELYRALHGQKTLISGHYHNNLINSKNFIKSNLLLIQTDLYEPITEKLIVIYDSSVLVWENYKNCYFLISLDFTITDFRQYIEVLKEFTLKEKLCFSYNFLGTEKFLKPENIKETIERFNIAKSIDESCNFINNLPDEKLKRINEGKTQFNEKLYSKEYLFTDVKGGHLNAR